MPLDPEFVEAIRDLGSPAAAVRNAACGRLFVAKQHFALNVARKCLGSHPSDVDADELAQSGWFRLFKRVLAGPLEFSIEARMENSDSTSEDVIGFAFLSFLGRCVRSAYIDERRRQGFRPADLLKKLRERLSNDKHKLWVTKILELEQLGVRWNDADELARATGQERGRLSEFIREVVEPALAPVFRQAESVPSGEPTSGAVSNELRRRLLERVSDLFGPGTKGHVVATAILELALTGDAFKGALAIDHRKLVERLDETGQPWKSCDLPHPPGGDAASDCLKCCGALQQWRTRVFREFRRDDEFHDLLVSLCKEIAEADVFFQEAVADFIRGLDERDGE